MLYKVVSANEINVLIKMVEDFLHQGWIVAGGISFDGNHYLQALTKS
jgi:hypothetical protein